MFPKWRLRSFFLTCGLLCQLGLLTAHGQGKYIFKQIFPDLKADSYGWGINGLGDVTGSYGWASNPAIRPYFYHAGVVHDILKGPALGGYYNVSINNYGLSVGHIEGEAAYGYMIYRGQLMQITEDYAWPVAVNQNGHIIGTDRYGAYLWRNFKRTTIGPFAPTGINSRDDVVGAGTGDLMLYSGGKLQDLGQPLGGSTYAVAINDSGTITGTSAGTNGSEGFIYTNGKAKVIDTTGFYYCSPIAINNLGQVAGRYFPSPTFTGDPLPFFYDGTRIVDLSKEFPADWSFYDPYNQMALNDAGQITGTGFYHGFRRAYLLTPKR